MRTFMHGTSYESAMNIMKNGFQPVETIWNGASDEDMFYVREVTDCDEYNYEAKTLCIESGQIAAAVSDSKDERLALVILQIDDDVAEDIVWQDESCGERMIHESFQIDKDDLNDAISSGKCRVKVEIYKDGYLPMLRVFYLNGLLDNMYIDLSDEPILYETLRAIQNVDSMFMYDEDIIGTVGELEETMTYTSPVLV